MDFDALIVSAALLAEGKTLHSEDMQDGRFIERQLMIRDPFASSVSCPRSKSGRGRSPSPTASTSPKAGEPKIWFTSMRPVAEVLSDQYHALLKVIRETNPDSVAAPAKITGRQAGNLSRTLKTMSRDGLVDLQREKTHGRPVVKATDFRILAAA